MVCSSHTREEIAETRTEAFNRSPNRSALSWCSVVSRAKPWHADVRRLRILSGFLCLQQFWCTRRWLQSWGWRRADRLGGGRRTPHRRSNNPLTAAQAKDKPTAPYLRTIGKVGTTSGSGCEGSILLLWRRHDGRCRALHGEDVRRRVCDELVDNASDVECDDSSSSWL